jgi:hypothetical protein
VPKNPRSKHSLLFLFGSLDTLYRRYNLRFYLGQTAIDIIAMAHPQKQNPPEESGGFQQQFENTETMIFRDIKVKWSLLICD